MKFRETTPLTFVQDHRWVFLWLLLATVLLYAQTFWFAWTYDDIPVLVNNADIRSLGNFFDNSYPGRPLRELTFLLDHTLFGLDPAGYHLQNILWHALCGWLLFVLVRELGGQLALAWGAALLFLVHPVQVEVVANISHRKDSLALAFIFLSVLAYVRGCRAEHGRGWFAVALTAWGMCLLAKENAFVVPILWLLYEGLFLPAEQRRLLRFPLLPLAVGLAAALVLLFYVVWGGGWQWFATEFPRLLNKMNHPHGTVGDYFRMVVKSWAVMGWHFVDPRALAPEYVFPVPKHWFDPWALAGIGCGLGWLAGLLLAWKRAPLPAFFWGWLGILWLPTANLWPLSYFLADRYWYAPSPGLVVVLVALALALTRRVSVLPKMLAGVAIVIVVGGVTVRQSQHWRDSLSLWTHAAAVSPQSSGALAHLGIAHLDAGNTLQAIEIFKRSALNFNSAVSYYHLGRAYEQLGDTRSAIRYYCFFLGSPDDIIGADKAQIRQSLQQRLELRCN